MQLAQTSALHGLLAVREVPNTEDASGGLVQSGQCTVDVHVYVSDKCTCPLLIDGFDGLAAFTFEVNSICHFIHINVTCTSELSKLATEMRQTFIFGTPFLRVVVHVHHRLC